MFKQQNSKIKAFNMHVNEKKHHQDFWWPYQSLCNILYALCTGTDSTYMLLFFLFLSFSLLWTSYTSVSGRKHPFSGERSNSLPYTKYKSHRADGFTAREKFYDAWVYFCCIKSRRGVASSSHCHPKTRVFVSTLQYIPHCMHCTTHLGWPVGRIKEKIQSSRVKSLCLSYSVCGAVVTPVGQYIA